MATKFKVWIDSATAGTNVQADATYDSDTNRQGGFAAGDVVSSIKVNSALRSSSLITTALMEALLPSSNLGLTSALSDVVTALQGAIATKSDITTINNRIDTIAPPDSATIAQLQTAIDNIVNGTTTVGQAHYASSAGSANSATTASSDASGNNIKSTYGASLNLNGQTLSLLNKNGGTLNSVTLPSGGSGVSGTVGSQYRPIYLDNGTFKKMSVGSSNQVAYTPDGSNIRFISQENLNIPKLTNEWTNLGDVSFGSPVTITGLTSGLYAFIYIGNSQRDYYTHIAYVSTSTDVYYNIEPERVSYVLNGKIYFGSGHAQCTVQYKRLT